MVKSGGAPKVKVAVAVWTRVPLVPVIVTAKLPTVVLLQERVAVAGKGGVTLSGVIAPQVKPAGTVSVRATVPAKPFSASTVIVDVADVPAGTEAGEVAAMVKSTKMKVAVALWTSVPLVPVIVRVKVPAVRSEQRRVG
jgi:hypothetical protein